MDLLLRWDGARGAGGGARPSFPTLGGLVVPVPIRFYNTLGKGVGTMDGDEWVRVFETLVVDLDGV